MVIALLAVLGVDLIVIVVLLGAVLTRRRWVSHQPGAFKGAIRVAEGAVSGLGGKWKRGYGPRRRRCFETSWWRSTAGAVRAAEAGEVNRLGSQPVIVPLAAEGGARVEIAAAGDDRGRALGPMVIPAPSSSEGLREPPPQPLRSG